MHPLTIGVTVMHTRTEKTKVQSGSARVASGKKKIMVPATQTPILMIISPRAWRKAASTLMFLLSPSSSGPWLCPP